MKLKVNHNEKVLYRSFGISDKQRDKIIRAIHEALVDKFDKPKSGKIECVVLAAESLEEAVYASFVLGYLVSSLEQRLRRFILQTLLGGEGDEA